MLPRMSQATYLDLLPLVNSLPLPRQESPGEALEASPEHSESRVPQLHIASFGESTTSEGPRKSAEGAWYPAHLVNTSQVQPTAAILTWRLPGSLVPQLGSTYSTFSHLLDLKLQRHFAVAEVSVFGNVYPHP